MIPLAYFITYTCYGTRLHGDERGTVDLKHNEFRAPLLPADAARVQAMRERMRETAYWLDAPRRAVVLGVLREVAEHRRWLLIAAHARSTHVHAIVHAEADPHKVSGDFKAYSTRALKQEPLDIHRKHFWTEGASHRYLFHPDRLREEIHYVLDEQGDRMAVYEAERHILADLLI
jgi:REP element-mobilizing transposase RayT